MKNIITFLVLIALLQGCNSTQYIPTETSSLETKPVATPSPATQSNSPETKPVETSSQTTESVKTSSPATQSKSFAQWCENRESLAPATRRTVEVLLNQFSKDGNCQKADFEMRSAISLNLDLHQTEISDLSPLSSLNNLNALYLGWNQISDLTPLIGLTNLQTLYLADNQISDLTPLTGLTKLVSLHLHNYKNNKNKISDVRSLARLKNLQVLSLTGNRISNINTLAGLTNLKSLYIGETGTSMEDCPVKKLESVCRF